MGFEYWPWWLGGLALAGLTIFFRLATSKPLGVSGSWLQVTTWRKQREKARAEKAITQDTSAASNAMMAAALAEFGEDALDDAITDSAEVAPAQSKPVATPAPWTAHLLFLVCMFCGGLLWAFYTGNFHIQMQLSELHTQLSGTGWKMFFVLFIGGLFVGIGTQMAGGCSSGLGLCGCANLSRDRMIGTVFFSVPRWPFPCPSRCLCHEPEL
ncbi:YeeE/YedE family protein [Kaarinaea lacus]